MSLVPRRPGYVSLVRISPYNRPDSRRLYVVLKAYHDGSWDDSILTLGCLAAPEDVWRTIEDRWELILQREKIGAWHTADAMSCRGAFEKWKRSESIRVAGDLFALIQTFLPFDLLQWRSCSILRADYSEALRANEFLRPAEAICVDACMGRIVGHRSDDFPMLVYFDQHEEFMKHTDEVYRKAKSLRRRDLTWWKQVKCISAVNSDEFYPLQAADLVAWSMRIHDAVTNGQRRSTDSESWNLLHTIRVQVGDNHRLDRLPDILRTYPIEHERSRVEARDRFMGTKSGRR
jgi:hypothetical protein